MPRFSSLTCTIDLTGSIRPPAAPIEAMLAWEAKLSFRPWASYQPLSLCASSISGSTVMEPELSKLRLRPPKSDTLTPLNAMTDSGWTSNDWAGAPHMVSLTEKFELSTKVSSRLSYGLLVVLETICEVSPTSFKMPMVSMVVSFSTDWRSPMLVKLKRICGTPFCSSALPAYQL